jgi:quercetin dioxygenase-like cupin family protein
MSLIIYKHNFNSKFSDEKVVIEKVADIQNVRILLFFLKKGQIVNLHQSPSDVILTVLEGNGRFFIGSKEEYRDLSTGETIIYEPNEPHGFEALENLVVQAIITPIPAKKISL